MAPSCFPARVSRPVRNVCHSNEPGRHIVTHSSRQSALRFDVTSFFCSQSRISSAVTSLSLEFLGWPLFWGPWRSEGAWLRYSGEPPPRGCVRRFPRDPSDPGGGSQGGRARRCRAVLVTHGPSGCTGRCDSPPSKTTLVAGLGSRLGVPPWRGHPSSAFPRCPAASGLTSRLTGAPADGPRGRDVRLPGRVPARGPASSPSLRASARTLWAPSVFPCGRSESPHPGQAGKGGNRHGGKGVCRGEPPAPFSA